MSTGDLPAIIGAFGLLIGTVFTGIIGLGQRRTRLDRETLEELEQYRVWRPRVRRAVVILQDLLAVAKVPEPAGLQDLLEFPPPQQARHSKGGPDDPE